MMADRRQFPYPGYYAYGRHGSVLRPVCLKHVCIPPLRFTLFPKYLLELTLTISCGC
jgi:hypothetical protein